MLSLFGSKKMNQNQGNDYSAKELKKEIKDAQNLETKIKNIRSQATEHENKANDAQIDINACDKTLKSAQSEKATLQEIRERVLAKKNQQNQAPQATQRRGT